MLKNTKPYQFEYGGEKFALISDLHLNHYGKDMMRLADSIGDTGQEDTTLILAGDIFDGPLDNPDTVSAMKATAGNYKQTLWVLGNHEFMRHTPQSALELAGDVAKRSGIKLLEMGTVEFDGFSLHGATGWYPYKTGNELVEYNMIDFHRIKGHKQWVYDHHAKTRRWLQKNVTSKDLVVTHHLPCQQAVHPKWLGNRINCFFVSDFDDVLASNIPAMWMHGHSHESMNQKVNKTTLVRNPYGYPGEGTW